MRIVPVSSVHGEEEEEEEEDCLEWVYADVVNLENM